MMVGAVKRIRNYLGKGLSIRQETAGKVESAYQRLISSGFTRRLAIGVRA
jgi:hypothetical protein